MGLIVNPTSSVPYAFGYNVIISGEPGSVGQATYVRHFLNPDKDAGISVLGDESIVNGFSINPETTPYRPTGNPRACFFSLSLFWCFTHMILRRVHAKYLVNSLLHTARLVPHFHPVLQVRTQ